MPVGGAAISGHEEWYYAVAGGEEGSYADDEASS